MPIFNLEKKALENVQVFPKVGKINKGLEI